MKSKIQIVKDFFSKTFHLSEKEILEQQNNIFNSDYYIKISNSKEKSKEKIIFSGQKKHLENIFDLILPNKLLILDYLGSSKSFLLNKILENEKNVILLTKKINSSNFFKNFKPFQLSNDFQLEIVKETLHTKIIFDSSNIIYNKKLFLKMLDFFDKKNYLLVFDNMEIFLKFESEILNNFNYQRFIFTSQLIDETLLNEFKHCFNKLDSIYILPPFINNYNVIQHNIPLGHSNLINGDEEGLRKIIYTLKRKD